jgi:hypothetical protein
MELEYHSYFTHHLIIFLFITRVVSTHVVYVIKLYVVLYVDGMIECQDILV